MELLNEFLKRNRSKKISIHCVGDAMIDEYYSVQVNRISPEFPMPMMHSPNENCNRCPGGVANVAHQLRNFNVDARLISFADLNATHVFRSHNILYSPCTNVSLTIPRKKRWLDDGVQVNRWDVEAIDCGMSVNNYADALKDSLEMTTDYEKPDVAILSDYGKGFLPDQQRTQWIRRYKDSITIVDPKNKPILSWKGCTVFKPNKKEALELSGLSDWKSQCDFFVKTLKCKAVVITHGAEGIVGWSEDCSYFSYLPGYKKTPESVVGAGDCFVAFLGLAMAHCFTTEQAATIACEAGAIYVRGKMNRPIVPAELSKDRCVEPEDLLRRDFKLVFTNGCFDLIHRGHLQTLSFAKSRGEKLVVALNSDESVRRLKGEDRPIKNITERMAVMAELKDVDFVMSFEEDTPLEIIKRCKPDVLVKGSDYELTKIVGADIVPEVYQSPMIEGLSTTGLLTRGAGIIGTK